MSHINVPIFVVHLGCPHTCVFCNQRTITGQTDATLSLVDQTVEEVISSLEDPSRHDLQIAFFGGSFTAIERSRMIALLEQAESHIRSGKVDSIRLSTRPDAIDREILEILSRYSVKAIELGIQSTNDAVLSASERGHTAEESRKACRLIKEYGFELVGQMMLGLPLSTPESEKKTAEDMIAWGIDKARIYPCVVFADTALERQMNEGSYTPLTVEDATERAAEVYALFCEHEIDVIRIGLCENEGLRSKKTVGGAYHPALGELVINRYYLTKIMNAAKGLSLPKNAALVIETAPRALSKAIGQKKCNLHALEKAYPENRILFRTSFTLSGKDVKIFVKEN